MKQGEVIVSIRKGLGPEWKEKHFSFGYDDLPEGTTDNEIKEMAIRDVERRLYNSEDYPAYGKNWMIKEVVFT